MKVRYRLKRGRQREKERKGRYQFIDLGQASPEQDKQDIQQVNRAH